MVSDDFRVSSGFAVLPISRQKIINMLTSTIASSSARPWLASGHPKLNRGRMDLSHPVAFFLAPSRSEGAFDAH